MDKEITEVVTVLSSLITLINYQHQQTHQILQNTLKFQGAFIEAVEKALMDKGIRLSLENTKIPDLHFEKFNFDAELERNREKFAAQIFNGGPNWPENWPEILVPKA